MTISSRGFRFAVLFSATFIAPESTFAQSEESVVQRTGVDIEKAKPAFVYVIHQTFSAHTDELLGYVMDSTYEDRVVKWSLTTGNVVVLVQLRGEEIIPAMGVAEAGDRLAYVLRKTRDHSLVCRELGTDRDLWRSKLPDDRYRLVWFIRSTGLIGVAGAERILLFNSNTGSLVSENDSLLDEYHTNSVRTLCVLVSQSGRALVLWNLHEGRGDNPIPWLFPSAKPNKWITVWDVVENRAIARIPTPGSQVGGIAFTPDEMHLAISEATGVLKILPIVGSDSVRQVRCKPGWFISTADSTLVVLEESEERLSILTYPGLVTLREVDYHGSWSISPPRPEMALSPSGDKVSLQIGSRVCIYSVNPWKEILSIDPYQLGTQRGR